MSPRLGLLLDPLDVLFFRDGRPFGPASVGASGLPMPQTVAGALRALLLDRVGCDFPVLHRQIRAGTPVFDAMRAASHQPWVADVVVRGPWLARVDGDTPAPMVPTPAVLRRAKRAPDAGIERLAPLPESLAGRLPGARLPPPLRRPLWQFSSQPTEPVGGFVTLAGLQRFLDGGVPDPGDLVAFDALAGFDRRTGVGIDREGGAAEEGLIYAASFLALRRGVQLYVEVDADAAARALLDGAVLRLGGEGRRASVRVVRPVAWPERSAPGKGAVVVLTTPGLFAAAWHPQRLGDTLLAAAVPASLPVSGWNMAAGAPKPTRFAAVAGSTYFVSDSNLTAPSLADVAADAADGWGCYVKGSFADE